MFQGYEIPPYYDSMIAKLIVKGRDRQDAIAKMRSALGEFVVEGVMTNLDFQYEILNHPKFKKGDFSTAFIEEEYPELL